MALIWIYLILHIKYVLPSNQQIPMASLTAQRFSRILRYIRGNLIASSLWLNVINLVWAGYYLPVQVYSDEVVDGGAQEYHNHAGQV